MSRLLLRALPVALLAGLLFGVAPGSQADPDAPPDPKRFGDFEQTVKGAKEYDGLFKLYRKDENLFIEIRQDQFDKPLLAPIAIARGMGMGGATLNFDEQWV